MGHARWLAAALAVAAVGLVIDLRAERMGYPPAEFAARRQALATSLGKRTVILFGRTAPQAGIRFRQDNDFYYFTGNEDLNAAMVLNAATGSATLYPAPAPPAVFISGGDGRLNRENPAVVGDVQAARVQLLAQLRAAGLWEEATALRARMITDLGVPPTSMDSPEGAPPT